MDAKLLSESQFLEPAGYGELASATGVFSTLLLFQMAQTATELRNRIVKNLIARGATTLESICVLWNAGHFSDCWALHRTLLDRVFHLQALATTGDFVAFDDWCFKHEYEAGLRLLSDDFVSDDIKRETFNPTREQKTRYASICKAGVTWRRPKAKDVARSAELSFLYTYGYDYGSKHVHPMSRDGEEEFFRRTGFSAEVPDHRAVLHNSILGQKILLQLGLNASSVRWHNLFFDFCDGIRAALLGDDKTWRRLFLSIGTAGPEFKWWRAETGA